jgi:hypothetical protein
VDDCNSVVASVVARDETAAAEAYTVDDCKPPSCLEHDERVFAAELQHHGGQRLRRRLHHHAPHAGGARGVASAPS